MQRPDNLLRDLCAIEFRTEERKDDLDLVGTINFHDPIVEDDENNNKATFGLLKCRLSVSLSSGSMPLRYQLAQKQLTISPVGETLKQRKHEVDQELEGKIEAGARGIVPSLTAATRAKQRELTSTTGDIHQPQYLIHVDICGDSTSPAWRISSVAAESALVGVLMDETFGRIVAFSEQTKLLIELSVSSADLKLEIEGDNAKRNKALREFLLHEIKYLLQVYGPLGRQELCIG
jgi:hypothetical protein